MQFLWDFWIVVIINNRTDVICPVFVFRQTKHFFFGKNRTKHLFAFKRSFLIASGWQTIHENDIKQNRGRKKDKK